MQQCILLLAEHSKHSAENPLLNSRKHENAVTSAVSYLDLAGTLLANAATAGVHFRLTSCLLLSEPMSSSGGRSTCLMDVGSLHEQWLRECKDAAGNLHARVRQAKTYRSQCWGIYEAALSIVMTLEQSLRGQLLSSSRIKEFPQLFAAAVSTIELAQSIVQVRRAVTTEVRARVRTTGYVTIRLYICRFTVVSDSSQAALARPRGQSVESKPQDVCYILPGVQ